MVYARLVAPLVRYRNHHGHINGLESLALKFFWSQWNTLQNYACFVYHVCFYCARFWDPGQREVARPYCLMNTLAGKVIENGGATGHSDWYDRDDYTPPHCGLFLAK